jgi:hypothetical protein
MRRKLAYSSQKRGYISTKLHSNKAQKTKVFKIKKNTKDNRTLIEDNIKLQLLKPFVAIPFIIILGQILLLEMVL